MLQRASIASVRKSNILRVISRSSGFFAIPPDVNRSPAAKEVEKAKEAAKNANTEPAFQPNIRPYRRLSAQEGRIPNMATPETMDINQYQSIFISSEVEQFNMTSPQDAEERTELLRQILNASYKNKKPATIKTPIYLQFGNNLTIGDNFVADVECVLLAAASIKIGDNCVLGPNVHIYTAAHPIDPKARLDYSLTYPVEIGNNVWIGGGSVVCPGVTIGDNVRVKAGSVVVKDIPSNVEIGGIPATVLRQLDEEVKSHF